MGVELDGSSGGGEEQLEFGYILKEGPVRFADRLDVGQERKRRAKNDSQVLAFATKRMEEINCN